MNNFLSKEDLQHLLKQNDEILLSLYVDTNAKDNPKNHQIKFKDLINRAKIILDDIGYSPKQVSEYLEPAVKIEQNDELWQYQSKGFAYFLDKNKSSKYFVLNSDVPNLVHISSRYHLKPLLRYKILDKPFWILYLNKDRSELYRASMQTIKKVELDKLSGGLDDVMQRKDTDEKSLQFHTKTMPQGGQRSAMHHGQGELEIYEEVAIRSYFIKLNNTVIDIINPSQDPLIIAGDKYLHPIYRKVNSYSRLTEEGIEKNIQKNRLTIIHESALEIIKPQSKKKITADINRFSDNKNSGNASTEIQEIVHASMAGKVNTLFIKNGKNLWGKYKISESSIEVLDEQTTESIDLLSIAAEETYKRGDTVHFINEDEFPVNSDVAAILYL